MRLESSVEKASVLQAKSIGWSSVKINGPYKKGWPDRLFWKEGRFVWIEFKRPKGFKRSEGKLAALQAAILRKLKREGCNVAVCDNVKQCLQILKTIDAIEIGHIGVDLTDGKI